MVWTIGGLVWLLGALCWGAYTYKTKKDWNYAITEALIWPIALVLKFTS
jgi:hypothetical protein